MALAVPVEFTNSSNGSSHGGSAYLNVLTAAASDTYTIVVEGSATGAFGGEQSTIADFTADGGLDASAIGSRRVAISGAVPFVPWGRLVGTLAGRMRRAAGRMRGMASRERQIPNFLLRLLGRTDDSDEMISAAAALEGAAGTPPTNAEIPTGRTVYDTVLGADSELPPITVCISGRGHCARFALEYGEGLATEGFSFELLVFRSRKENITLFGETIAWAYPDRPAFHYAIHYNGRIVDSSGIMMHAGEYFSGYGS